MSEGGISAEPEKVRCPMCNRTQNCYVLSRLQKAWTGHGGTYSILECRGCNQVFYQTISWDENDVELWNDESGAVACELNYSESIYPKPIPDVDSKGDSLPSEKLSKGGRPPIADWEAAMVEVARALYLGDLKPNTQADIEKAIAEYLSGKGKDPSESTIREHARPLWNGIKDEAEK